MSSKKKAMESEYKCGAPDYSNVGCWYYCSLMVLINVYLLRNTNGYEESHCITVFINRNEFNE